MTASVQGQLVRPSNLRVCDAAGGEKTMIHVSCASLVPAVLFGVAACFVLGGTLAASRHTHSVEVELDRLIPREKWAGAGINKLTVAGQQRLADDITALPEASRVERELSESEEIA
jgi:hypothetical protein